MLLLFPGKILICGWNLHFLEVNGIYKIKIIRMHAYFSQFRINFYNTAFKFISTSFLREKCNMKKVTRVKYERRCTWFGSRKLITGRPLTERYTLVTILQYIQQTFKSSKLICTKVGRNFSIINFNYTWRFHLHLLFKDSTLMKVWQPRSKSSKNFG